MDDLCSEWSPILRLSKAKAAFVKAGKVCKSYTIDTFQTFPFAPPIFYASKSEKISFNTDEEEENSTTFPFTSSTLFLRIDIQHSLSHKEQS